MSATRRRLAVTALCAFGLVAAAAVAACQPGGTAPGAAGGGAGKALSKHEQASDLPMGSKDAKVVLVEYASITCPHCANFHTQVLPAVKTKYVDTGKVRYVFREFPTSPLEMAQAGHLIARCAGPDKRDGVIDTMMRQQEDLFRQAQGPNGLRQAFMTIARSAGMSDQAFEACLKNEELLKLLVEVRASGIEKGVEGTPTLFINGEKYAAPAGREINAEDMTKALDAALAKAG
jgi:protein-disulfide isomerase